MDAERFWKIVKKEVERQNTSYEYLYRKTGIAKGTFSAWKSRRIMPRAGDACRIACALDVSLEYLLTGAEGGERSSNPLVKEITALLPLLSERDLAGVKALVNVLAEER